MLMQLPRLSSQRVAMWKPDEKMVRGAKSALEERLYRIEAYQEETDPKVLFEGLGAIGRLAMMNRGDIVESRVIFVSPGFDVVEKLLEGAGELKKSNIGVRAQHVRVASRYLESKDSVQRQESKKVIVKALDERDRFEMACLGAECISGDRFEKPDWMKLQEEEFEAVIWEPDLLRRLTSVAGVCEEKTAWAHPDMRERLWWWTRVEDIAKGKLRSRGAVPGSELGKEEETAPYKRPTKDAVKAYVKDGLYSGWVEGYAKGSYDFCDRLMETINRSISKGKPDAVCAVARKWARTFEKEMCTSKGMVFEKVKLEAARAAAREAREVSRSIEKIAGRSRVAVEDGYKGAASLHRELVGVTRTRTEAASVSK